MNGLKLLTCTALLSFIFSNAQVSSSSSGRVNNITTDFSFAIDDGQYNRPLLRTGWLSGIGDYLYLKHGGANTDTYTYGLRISDGYGLDFGSNNFATSFLKVKINGNVGIGTNAPMTKLHVLDQGSGGTASGTTPTNGIVMGGSGTGGVLNMGINASGLFYSWIQSRHKASANFYNLALNPHGGKVGIGTTNPDSKLTVKGKIHAEEVKVDLSVPGPDYVFKEDYNLRSLEEVQNYIKEFGHLPNIPSAKEMEANGIQLGEMNMKLLEKIEELTLYTLEQEKKIEQLEREVEKNKNQDLRISKLEKLLIN
ncbi:tail fiber protein [Flagellimonas pacifica]|uniref:BZIP transcription factor n=1 Tax=Flagellimonas pacifica TaxID=1247520 RepID=A0A285MT17_9FLAO|nr:tail fiber protein [Allomuricauda parva]SNY99677.1 hypothetical protein SAMN06265377_1488 [Allomuricauda parva]